MNIRPVLITIVFCAIALIALLQLMKPPEETYSLASTMTNNLQSLVTYTPFPDSKNAEPPTPIPTPTAATSTELPTPVPTATDTPTLLPTATVDKPPTSTLTPLPTTTDTPLPTATSTEPPTPTLTPLPTTMTDGQAEKTSQASILIYQGIKYATEKQYNLAIQAYEESIRLSPMAEAYAGLGTVYIILAESGLALTNLQEAIKLDPGIHLRRDSLKDRGRLIIMLDEP